jgi:hypothetical protein
MKTGKPFLASLNTSTLFLIVCAAPLAAAPAGTGSDHARIPFSEIGARATADYQGDALGITATAEGARLRCAFQKLDGHATVEGLWLESTAPNAAGQLRLVATAVGRESSRARQCALTQLPAPETSAPTDVGGYAPLPATGTVDVADKLVRFIRPGLTEEYSVSADGVRQDFVITERPAGAGDLRVELALSGARAKAAAYGARLTLEGSGRALAYSRLRVADATGQELTAHIEVVGREGLHSVPNSEWEAVERVPPSARLEVVVADANATYPVRIDPTFSDADWARLDFGLLGANDYVNAIVLDDQGNVYVAGNFAKIGTTEANRIAKWNGRTWSALGAGMNSNVYALALDGTNLYAGGIFTMAGQVPANYIARWDGSGWNALGSGMAGTQRPTIDAPGVYALAAAETKLYAGGVFLRAGEATALYLAQWDGSVWSPVGAGMDGKVLALAVSATDLYAGGAFTNAGRVTANFVARWDGTNWSALGSGMNSWVHALAVRGSTLYAGGDFTTAGGMPAFRVGRWDGTNWSALAEGLNGNVRSLLVREADLYVGGYFTTATNTGGVAVTVNRIARWDGRAWSPLGSGMSGEVNALAVMEADLYAGGAFFRAGEVSANGIAKWDGSAWSVPGSPGFLV